MSIKHWWFTAPLRLRSLLRRRRVEAEMEEELRFHLENKTEEGIARGLSPLTAFVALTLALGIGMSAAAFSGLDALVFRPYPVPRSDDVVTLLSTTRDNRFGPFSYREYLDIRDGTASYDGVVASGALRLVGFSATPDATPRAKAGMIVSGNYFRVLGVDPQIGRGFRDGEDEVPGRDAVVVLGHDFWRNEFAQDPSVVGRTIRLNGADFTVIGVAPESFPGMQVFARPDLYTPLAMARLFTDPQKASSPIGTTASCTSRRG